MLVENFRPGTMTRLGPGLRTAGGSAIPAPGLLLDLRLRTDRARAGEEPGYDAVVQAEGGLMSITGAADGQPFRLGVAISDIVSGMFAAQGVALRAARA